MGTKSAGRNPLNLVLERMFDETGLFTRSEWATILSNSEDYIGSLISPNCGIPSSTDLKTVYDIVKRAEGNPKVAAILAEFESLLDKNYRDTVYPHVLKSGSIEDCATLGEYINRGLLDGFIRVLSTCTYSQQQEVLYQAAQIARDKRNTRPAIKRAFYLFKNCAKIMPIRLINKKKRDLRYCGALPNVVAGHAIG